MVYNKEYYQTHSENMKKSIAKYRKANPEKVKEWNRKSWKKRRLNNPEYERERHRKYREKNKIALKIKHNSISKSNQKYLEWVAKHGDVIHTC